jgi:hypothetical protein
MTQPNDTAELPAASRGRAGAAGAAWRRPKAGASRRVEQHHIGLLYIGTALLFFLLAGVLA